MKRRPFSFPDVKDRCRGQGTSFSTFFCFYPTFFQDFSTRFSRRFPGFFVAFSCFVRLGPGLCRNAVFRFAGSGPLRPLVVRRSCGPWGRGDFSSRGGHDVHGEPVTRRRAGIRVREGREGLLKRRPNGVRENMTCENLIRRSPLGTVQSIMDPVCHARLSSRTRRPSA